MHKYCSKNRFATVPAKFLQHRIRSAVAKVNKIVYWFLFKQYVAFWLIKNYVWNMFFCKFTLHNDMCANDTNWTEVYVRFFFVTSYYIYSDDMYKCIVPNPNIYFSISELEWLILHIYVQIQCALNTSLKNKCEALTCAILYKSLIKYMHEPFSSRRICPVQYQEYSNWYEFVCILNKICLKYKIVNSRNCLYHISS